MSGTIIDVSDDPVAVLQRWEDAGAVWRVLHRNDASVTVGLFTCDGGEEVDRVTSDAAALLAFIGARTSNLD
ncbi:hypothetical protein [[Mycobacterium] wendilense]|uniref:hypothetical protein n=1 Tax=[Mycobacterium] wendilense TaxID=3064284 RepID=UPI0037CC11D9